MSRSPLILLPPSEGKSTGGDFPPWVGSRSTPELDDHRREVMAALGSAMKRAEAHRRKLLGVGEVATRVATAVNRSLAVSPTTPAIDRYTGVLYDALDAGSLNSTARRRLDSRVLILSGLWGVVSPADLIPDYKLKMGANLPRLGKLSTWWRSRMSSVLDDQASGRVVWDLRPKEHAAAWPVGSSASRTVEVRFLEERPGRGLVTVAHWNKLLKGALTRHLICISNPSVDSLADFSFEGFHWEPDTTTESATTTITDVIRRI